MHPERREVGAQADQVQPWEVLWTESCPHKFKCGSPDPNVVA